MNSRPKHLQVLALVTAALLVGGAASIAAATGLPAFRSSARSTVTPPSSPRRPQRPQAAKIASLQRSLLAAKARVKSLKIALAKAKTPGRRRALRQSLTRAQARVKALQAALNKAEKAACGKGYRYVKGRCLPG